MVTADAFFEPDGQGFVATAYTRGPWDESSQHGGPPAALLARAVELELPDEFRLARLSLDILRPVPIGHVVPRAKVHVGRRVARALVSLEADGVEVMTGTALGQIVSSVEVKTDSTPSFTLPDEADEADEKPFFPLPWEGYHTAMQARFVEGGFTEAGPARVWMAQRVPLVSGEDPSPAQRTIVVADSGNGVSSSLDFTRFGFVNSDLTIHLYRDPVGEWIGMDAVTLTEPTGAGLATTVLHDVNGPVGRGNQTLLITQYDTPSQ